MYAVAESRSKEMNPSVSFRFSLVVENEWVDAEQDGQTCLASQILRLELGQR